MQETSSQRFLGVPCRMTCPYAVHSCPSCWYWHQCAGNGSEGGGRLWRGGYPDCGCTKHKLNKRLVSITKKEEKKYLPGAQTAETLMSLQTPWGRKPSQTTTTPPLYETHCDPTDPRPGTDSDTDLRHDREQGDWIWPSMHKNLYDDS